MFEPDGLVRRAIVFFLLSSGDLDADIKYCSSQKHLHQFNFLTGATCGITFMSAVFADGSLS